MPGLKRKYLYAEDFAKASLTDLFSLDKLRSSDTLIANYFSNAVLLNRGDLTFDIKALPWMAQLTSFRDAVVVDANGDKLPDIMLFGNYYDNNIQMGRYDADFGTILINKGQGNFDTESVNGLAIKGQVRRIEKIKIGNRDAFVIARNNDSTMVIRYRQGDK